MLHAVIIEDEKHIADLLVSRLREIKPSMEIRAILNSVQETIDYFSHHAGAIDIIFSDIQLGDGLSFEAFQKIKLSIPIIFITCYDQFMIESLEHNSLDYLLKPVRKKDLESAILKYEQLEKHFLSRTDAVKDLLQGLQRHKKRLLVKYRHESVPMLVESIVLFHSQKKLTHATDQLGRRYIIEKNLAELEALLDPSIFFRANRQHIININFIKGFRSYERVKIQVDMQINNPHADNVVVISQETAGAFRKWVNS
ncbi:MAG TPA: LytTR family DNA-binding domain-containing protein [Flavisolibacter sp.]|nr:LytTR family DNA-binding domain-containing protein [Flavisolibacter sp.]